MKQQLTLDPVIEKQLQAYETELSSKIQDYLDHPEILPKFMDSLETNLERWCCLFGNLNNFAQKPTDPAGFDDVFNLARTGELDGEGLKQYISTMLNEYEKYTYGEYARREGYKEGEAAGIEKGKEELVKQLLRMKVPIETIQQASGFTKEQIEAL